MIACTSCTVSIITVSLISSQCHHLVIPASGSWENSRFGISSSLEKRARHCTWLSVWTSSELLGQVSSDTVSRFMRHTQTPLGQDHSLLCVTRLGKRDRLERTIEVDLHALWIHEESRTVT